MAKVRDIREGTALGDKVGFCQVSKVEGAQLFLSKAHAPLHSLEKTLLRVHPKPIVPGRQAEYMCKFVVSAKTGESACITQIRFVQPNQAK